MQHHHSTVPLSIRIRPGIRNQLEVLADATGRTKSYLAAEALELYIEMQAWQVQAIEKSLKNANSKTAKFTEHRKVSDWLNSWGMEEEQDFPE